jgi:formylglycine-generating enzyme required for sulfatase activity
MPSARSLPLLMTLAAGAMSPACREAGPPSPPPPQPAPVATVETKAEPKPSPPEPPATASPAPDRPAAEPPPDPKPTEENSLGMVLVRLPAGSFRMGTPAGEGGAKDEKAHEVRLTRGFLIGRFEVTNAEFRRFRPDHRSGKYAGHDLDGDRQPVVMVGPADAEAFCEWLSGRPAERAARRRFRLPTEAEWEYACRAGTRTGFWWGEWPRPDLFNFADRNDPGGRGEAWADDGSAVTAPVGKYRPNPWGLHEMHGNAGEWVADWYAPYPPGTAESPAVDPAGPPRGSFRIERGGNWYSDPDYGRSASRVPRAPNYRSATTGFRVACDEVPAVTQP